MDSLDNGHVLHKILTSMTILAVDDSRDSSLNKLVLTCYLHTIRSQYSILNDITHIHVGRDQPRKAMIEDNFARNMTPFYNTAAQGEVVSFSLIRTLWEEKRLARRSKRFVILCLWRGEEGGQLIY